MKSILIQFIPIFLCVFLVLYPKDTMLFSNTILGKIIAISIILFYSSIDILYGLVACAIIIFYYNYKHTEGMDAYCAPNKKLPDEINNQENNETCVVEGMSDCPCEHDDPPKELRHQFEKQYCKKHNLTYKNMDVKDDMIYHVFPEIEFKNNRCNPCDKNCEFSVIEEKLKHEDDLTKPKDSNDWTWSSMFSSSNEKKEIKESIGVVSEPFSFLN